MAKILMYHYIQDFKKDFPEFNFLHRKNFFKQINFLSQKKNFFNIGEDFELQKKIKNKIILSFDDGLKSHLNIAKYLSKQNICGIFSIPTSQIITNDFLDIHKLHLMFGKYSFKKINNILIEFQNNKKPSVLKEKVLFKSFLGQKKFFRNKNQSTEDRNKILLKTKINYLSNFDKKLVSKIFNILFSKQYQKKIFKSFYLNKKDIRQISKLNMIISSHSHEHNNLSLIKKNSQLYDIKKSKRILETITSKKIKFFTYPYGDKGTYNADTLAILRNLKFKYGISVYNKDFISRINNLEIPRFDCNLFKFGKVIKKNV